VALWFHSATLVLSSIPLAVGWPQHATLPSLPDLGATLGVALTSFWGQLLLTRGFQLLDASKAAAINFTQVGPPG
jgi:drug/metabolite transporter (DMT)-like permease